MTSSAATPVWSTKSRHILAM